MSKTQEFIHQNFFGETGKVFCKKQNKIVDFDSLVKSGICSHCKYFYGSLQGDGVECIYEDSIPGEQSFHSAYNPQQELLRISKLIDNKVIKKG